jgi:hypothetical protein
LRPLDSQVNLVTGDAAGETQLAARDADDCRIATDRQLLSGLSAYIYSGDILRRDGGIPFARREPPSRHVQMQYVSTEQIETAEHEARIILGGR